MITANKYKMSFTTSYLRRSECVQIAALFLQLADWNAVQKEVLSSNILQLNTISSRRRIFAELKLRLESLSLQEMQILARNIPADVDIVLWLAVCRTYSFIGEFAKEIVHEKYVSFKKNIDSSDYELFYERKSSLHPELAKLTDSTKRKLRQVVFKLLRECGIVNRNNEILASYLSSEILEHIAKDELGYFPTTHCGAAS